MLHATDHKICGYWVYTRIFPIHIFPFNHNLYNMKLNTLVLLCVLSCTATTFGQKLSQFEKAGLVDLLIDKKGQYHAVFQETPDYGKPSFIYYTSSSNRGVSWTKPVNISNDNTGNGAGYPRIIQDGLGTIYALWKRYGNTKNGYPIATVTTDGPGGYSPGTVFYKVLQGGAWSAAVQLNEVEQSQYSWFPTVTPQGVMMVFWTQLSPESIKNNLSAWYYADYMRVVSLNATARSAYTDLTVPSPPAYPGGAPPQEGAISFNGYVDANNLPHFVFEEVHDNVQQVKYFDGKQSTVIYNYPKYSTFNNFNHPATLLVDEKGVEHIIFKPAAATLESEQIWDYSPATKQQRVLVSIAKPNVKIIKFQAWQGPAGEMAVTVQAGTYSSSRECYGSFYKRGVWTNTALTKNAAKEQFFGTEFRGLGGYPTAMAMLTKYDSDFTRVAWDAQGKKALLMNVSAYWVGGGVSSPSIVFSQLD